MRLSQLAKQEVALVMIHNPTESSVPQPLSLVIVVQGQQKMDRIKNY